MDHFEQLVVVAVVDVDADEYRTLAVVQGSLQDRRDLLGDLIIIPMAPNASAYLTTTTGPKSVPDGRPPHPTAPIAWSWVWRVVNYD